MIPRCGIWVGLAFVILGAALGVWRLIERWRGIDSLGRERKGPWFV